MRALITGGCGFIGQHLARQLRDRYELEAIDILHPQVHLDAQASRDAFPGHVIVADITDPDAYARAQRPDVVFHLAAETGTAQSMYEAERYRRVNEHGTRLAAEAARAWDAPIVALSSRAVYGEGRYRLGDATVFGLPDDPDAQPEASRESDEHRPTSVYGETKSAAEALLAAVSAHVPVGVLRPQNVVGPGQALHNPYTGVFAAWLARLREGKSPLVYGAGDATRDVVHVSDVAVMIAWLAGQLSTTGQPIVLNCGTGVRSTLNDLACYAIAGSPTPGVGIEHVAMQRAGDIQHACADLTLARSLGAPEPAWTTAAAVKNFISWSWDKPGASSLTWESALAELAEHGFAP